MMVIWTGVRRALAGVAAIVVFAGVSAHAGDPFELQWTELDKGVWAGVRPISPRSPVVGTTLIVVGEKSALVFDRE